MSRGVKKTADTCTLRLLLSKSFVYCEHLSSRRGSGFSNSERSLRRQRSGSRGDGPVTKNHHQHSLLDILLQDTFETHSSTDTHMNTWASTKNISRYFWYNPICFVHKFNRRSDVMIMFFLPLFVVFSAVFHYVYPRSFLNHQEFRWCHLEEFSASIRDMFWKVIHVHMVPKSEPLGLLWIASS